MKIILMFEEEKLTLLSRKDFLFQIWYSDKDGSVCLRRSCKE